MSDFFSKIGELFSTPEYLDALLHGFWLTIQVSYFAILIGILLGTIIALVDVSKKTKWTVVPKFICSVYTTIIRGTPMALQLFIMFFVIFAVRGVPSLLIAILAFGLNSAAYTAEVIRGGILSVDSGQTEAGMALGLSQFTIFMKIVAPQAKKTLFLRLEMKSLQ